MKSDEQAIRDLVQTWLDASARGDYATVLSLMADDAVFMVPGQEPFGKDGWSERMKDVRVEGRSSIQEIKVVGEWAWLRQHLRMTVTQSNAKRSVLSGYALEVLRKKPDGTWVLARDANLVTPEKEAQST
ncbi:MAG: SgcJ/EcaC family oxidoreductase [Verrucomicrobiales bacterium]|nr:SgcJ/EcaC family oxidoreductase [Verrucomicrobiales bacterium]